MSLWTQLFGESQREAWGRLAAELGTSFEPPGLLKGSAVRARLGGYDLVLDNYTVSTGNSTQTYTRLRARFINPRRFQFCVHRASMFTGIAKALGKQDLEIGVPDFDRDFVIQGNDETRVRALLADPALRAMIAAQPRIKVQVADNEGLFGTSYGESVDILEFIEAGIIKDVQRLQGLFSLFAVLLRALNADKVSFLEVPPAELPAVFLAAIDAVAESLGGDAERVQDSVEARLPNPLGLAGGARCVVQIPRLPALASHFNFEAALPPGPEAFRAEKRGAIALGALKTGDEHIDDKLALRGTGFNRPAILRPLRAMADAQPTVVVEGEQLLVSAHELAADRAPALLGAALDLWQELTRMRAGEGER